MNAEEELLYRQFSLEDMIELIDSSDLEGLKAAFELDGFDINKSNSWRETALHHASNKENIDILELLTSHPHIDLNAKDMFSMTPLMNAANYGNLKSLKFLLEKGADATCYDEDGHTALYFASKSEEFSLESVKMLLRNKNCTSGLKKEEWLYRLIYKKRNLKILEIIKDFIIKSSDPYYANTFGEIILYYGCHVGSLDTVKLIVEKGVLDLNKTSESNRVTPLQTALCGPYLEIADYLIEKGASLTISDPYRQSVYEYAATYDHSETFLLKYEAGEEYLDKLFKKFITHSSCKTLRFYAEKCASQKYKNGPAILKQAVSYAYENDEAKSMAVLLSQCNDNDLIIDLAKKAAEKISKSKMFELLYEKFLELETSDGQIQNFRSDLFISALENGNTIAAMYFLDRGLDPNEVKKGESHLIRACRKNYTKFVEALLKYGADVNQLNAHDESALNYATANHNLKNVQILLKYGADPHVKDQKGFTPLLLSAHNGDPDVFFELFNQDKNLCQRSNDQLTPFLAACKSGNTTIVKALIEAGACLTDVDNQNRNCLHFAAENEDLCECLFNAVDKMDFHRMIIAKDAEGKRPIESIIRNHNETTIPDILLAFPDLTDLINDLTEIEIQNSEQEMCLICRENFEQDDIFIELPCKHEFHESCYNEWGKRNEFCPYCQRSTNE